MFVRNSEKLLFNLSELMKYTFIIIKLRPLSETKAPQNKINL